MSVKWENSLSVNFNSSDSFMKVGWEGWVVVYHTRLELCDRQTVSFKKCQAGS